MPSNRKTSRMSIRSKLLRHLLIERSMRKLCDPLITSLEEMRASSIKVDKRLKIPKNAKVEPVENESFRGEWLCAGSVIEDTRNVILYFHSGAFCLGYNNAHRTFALELSKRCNARVLAIDYRLAPEHPFPAANEDCLASYRWLLECNIDPQNIVAGGDSAGAGLALMTLLALKKAGDPMPQAAFLLSLFGGDLKNFDGESYETRESSDPLNSKEGIQYFANLYMGEKAIDPPIAENMEGLPSLLIQVGSDEILLSDSTRLADSAKKAGVNVVFEEWDGMWHVFQGFFMLMPEAKKAMHNISTFVNSNWNES